MPIVAEPGGGTGPNVGGVDTHRDTHVAAVLDPVGRVLGSGTFPVTPEGYGELLDWVRSFGPVTRIGVEGTGSWGKGLARSLTSAGIEVIEVTRPNRQRRRRHGKTDTLDAVAAGVSVLNGDATATAKTGDGPAESLRLIHAARESAVKARTAALNEFHAHVITAPEEIRTALQGLSTTAARRAAAAHQPAPNPTTCTNITWSVLRGIAQRVEYLDTEIAQLDQQRKTILDTHAPSTLRQRCGIGDWVAAQLLITVGDNPHRIHSEASLAALCGVSPVQASSGNTQRHRLNRGGDRQANRALHTIAITRLRLDPRTQAYADKRTKEGKTRKEIIRCLKRYITRELHHELTHPLT
jgi:transposase